MTPKSPGGRPYPVTLQWEETTDGYSGWVAAVDALPGCVSQGATAEEAVDGLAEATKDWIHVAQKRGMDVPEPRNVDDYSGRFLVRAPRSLHERLVQEAAAEGVSLNQFVTSALGAAVGWRVPAWAYSTGSGSGSESTPAKEQAVDEAELAAELPLTDSGLEGFGFEAAAEQPQESRPKPQTT